MTNAYVLSGYLAAAAVLVLYCVHLRHRGRALARALGHPGARPAPAAPVSSAPSMSSPVEAGGPGGALERPQ